MGLSSSTRRVWVVFALAWPLGVSGLAACTPLVPASPGPSLAVAAAPTPVDIVEMLERRDRRLGSFRAEAKLDYRSPTQHFRSSQMIAVLAPASVRIDVMNPFGVSYTVATDGERLAAFDRRKKIYYEGKATAENIRHYTGVPLSPSELAALVRGLPPLLGADRGGSVESADGAWLWRRSLPHGGSFELWLDLEYWDPVRLRVIDARSGREVEVTYFDYLDLDGVRVARRMAVSFSDGGKLGLTYQNVWRKVDLTPEAFRIQRPEQAAVVDMDKESAGG